VRVRDLRPSDWPEVRRIYAEGIATRHATFESEPPTWEAFDAGRLREPRLAAVDEADRVIGWAVLTPVSSRCVYGGVAEVSVYVAADARGRGVGTTLLEELVARSEAAGLWTLQSGIFPENRATLALHLKLGFREVGRRERIGRMDGTWRDTVLLERRSSVVGVD
jgi:phosphinothricin acetyltransferase